MLASSLCRRSCRYLLAAPLGQWHRHAKHCWTRSSSLTAAAGLALLASQYSQPSRCDEESSTRLYPKDLEKYLKPSDSNPAPVTVPPPFPGLARQQWDQRHVAPILGLPYRGKGHISRSLKRYIEFFHGARAEIFDINDYLDENGDERLYAALERFFDVGGDESFDDAYAFDTKRGKGGFAIILSSDSTAATHSKWSPHTKAHRKWIGNKLQDGMKAEVCFIQISCSGPKGDKYMSDLATHRGASLEEARELAEDFEDHFMPMEVEAEKHWPFIHVVNYNEAMVVNKVMRTFVGAHLCHFLSNLHPFNHEVYLSRHGESEFNVEQRIGGDSGLSPRGVEYARRVGEFAKYIVCGHCSDLVCVTLTSEDIKNRLRMKLVEDKQTGLLAHGDWEGFGDSSGATVKPSMQLKRVQLGYGADFEDAPRSLEAVMDMLAPASVVTLVFVQGETADAGKLPGRLWTSSLRRTIDTAKYIEHPVLECGPDGKPFYQMRGYQFRNTDEIYAGEYDGFRIDEIKEVAPDVDAARKRDKLGFRYPRGESYYDIIARLESVMSHLERIHEPILLISHQAVLRLVYSWLTHKSRDDALDTSVPQHEVIKITFDGLGGPPVETRFPLGPTKLVDDGQSSL